MLDYRAVAAGFWRWRRIVRLYGFASGQVPPRYNDTNRYRLHVADRIGPKLGCVVRDAPLPDQTP